MKKEMRALDFYGMGVGGEIQPVAAKSDGCREVEPA